MENLLNTSQKLYMAPMEGVTGHVYRRAHHQVFGTIDKYYTPFLGNSAFSKKEARDLDPKNNPGMNLVPQILVNHADLFLEITGRLQELGYREVNLNIGCPSGTVTAKGRGSGFLREPEKLEAFFDAIFAKCPVPISVKTRVGYSDYAEWPAIWNLLCNYPFSERIIHARVREDFYKKPANWDMFDQVLRVCNWEKESETENENLAIGESEAQKWNNDYAIQKSLCFNGDVLSMESYQRFAQRFGNEIPIMLGRGLIGNPGLAGEIKTGKPMTKEQLTAFLDLMEEGYGADMDCDQNAIWRLVEMWSYMKNLFPDGEKLHKKIRKSKSLREYHSIVHGALQEL